MRVRTVAALAVAVVTCGCVGPFSELQEANYPNSAVAKGADPSGWIPAILTDDASNIHEVHRNSGNETWGCFQTGQAPAVRLLLGRVNARQAPGSIANPPNELFRRFRWWPESMRTGSLEAWEFQETIVCAACSPFSVRVGIDAATGTVCFHRKTTPPSDPTPKSPQNPRGN